MDLTNILIWILLGAVAGWIAGLLMKGRGLGTVENIVVGIVGSFLGGWLATQLGISGAQVGGFSVPSVVTAVAGAVVLLFLIGLIKRR